MSVVLSEHLPLLATAPDGIQKLRGLILELAVRGKLVPQDPKDEPASELLKRVALERARLEAEGSCRKSKVTPMVGEDELLFKLPADWVWTNLATVSLVNPRNAADDSIEASFVPMAMIGTRFEGSHQQELRRWGEVKQGFTHFAEGDIGVAKITPCFENSKACVFAGLKNGIGAGTTELHVVRPIGQTLVPRYVLAYLKAPMFLAVGETKMTGTAGQKRLPKDFLEANPFPLPPLAEQHRIVAKVDELMALCDQLESEQADTEATHAKLVDTLLSTLTQSTDAADLASNWHRLVEHFDTLFTTESGLDALKQTILQLAVMGKLVPQALSDEPTSELLARIAQERARLEASGACKKLRPMSAVTGDEQLFELPGTWAWVRFGSIVDTRLGKMLDAAKNRGELKPYLRNTNVQWWRFDLDDIKEMRLTEDELSEFRLAKGDLLICEGGEPGRCAIWRSEVEEMYFQKALHRARPLGGCISEYLQIVLRQDAASGWLSSYFTGATIKHFPGDKLNSYVLPLPPVAEQHRIVAKVDEMLTLCDRLKADLAESRSRRASLASTLIESALKAA